MAENRAYAPADIGLVFGVMGGGSISGASGARIKTELENILKGLNESDAFKIDVSVSESSVRNVREQVERIKESFGAQGGARIDLAATMDAGNVAGGIKDVEKSLDSVASSSANSKKAISSMLMSVENRLNSVKKKWSDFHNSMHIGYLVGEGNDTAHALAAELDELAKAFGKLKNAASGDTAEINTQAERMLEEIAIFDKGIDALKKTTLEYQKNTVAKKENARVSAEIASEFSAVDRQAAAIRNISSTLRINRNDVYGLLPAEQQTAYDEFLRKATEIAGRVNAAKTANDSFTESVRESRDSLLEDCNACLEMGNALTKYVSKIKEMPQGGAPAFGTQTDVLSKQRSSALNAISKLGNSAVTEDEKAEVAELTSRYERFAQKVEDLRKSKEAMSSEAYASLKAEGAALQENVAAVQDRVNKERNAAREAEKGSKEQLANLSSIVSAYKRINDYLSKNQRISGKELDTLNSMRNQLAGEIAGANNNKGISITKKDLSGMLTQFGEIDASIVSAGLKGKSLANTIADAYKRFGGWAIVTNSLGNAVMQVRKMIDNVRELDAAMTELRKVTDAADGTYAEFLDNATVRAKRLGSTLVDTISSSADFARLGYSLDDAADLADAALIYKNVGDGIADVGEASESVISTMKAFGIEAEDAMGIVDEFNEVGNNFAISSAGIGEGLLNSASALAAAGNSLEESIAMITAANNVIQDPQKVGTALKTVSMFLRAAKTEAEEAGESTDGMASSVSELRDELLKLTGGRLDIQIDDDSFKSTYQILKELSGVWGELTDVSQANILEMIGGKRNSNVVMGLLSNFSTAEEVVKTAADSAGSALAENEKYLDSINGKIATFQASFEALSEAFIGSDLVKGVVDFGTDVVDILDRIIDQIGALPALVSAAAAAATVYSGIQHKGDSLGLFGLVGDNIAFDPSGKRSAIAEYNKLVGQAEETQKGFVAILKESEPDLAAYLENTAAGAATFKEFTKSCKEAKNAAKDTGDAVADAGRATTAVGIKAKMASAGVTILNTALNMLAGAAVSIAISAIASGIDAVVNAASNASEKADEAAASMKEEADAALENSDKLDELIARYKELREGGELNAESRQEAADIQAKVNELVTTEGDRLDLVNGKLDEELEKLEKKRRLQAEDTANAAKASYNAAVDAESKAVPTQGATLAHPGWGRFAYTGWKDKSAIEALESAGYAVDAPKANIQTGGWAGSSMYIRDLYTKEGELLEGIEEKRGLVRDMLDTLKEAGETDSAVFTGLQKQYDEYGEYLDKTNEAAQGLLSATYDVEKYNDALDGMAVDSAETYKEYRDALADAIKDNAEIQSALSNGDISATDIDLFVDDRMAEEYPQMFDAVTSAANGVVPAVTNLSETLGELRSSYDLIAAAQKEMAEGNGLSESTIASLAAANEDYIDYLYEENGVIKLNTDAWEEYVRQKAQGEMADIGREISQLQEENSRLEERNRLLSEGNREGLDASPRAGSSAMIESALKSAQEVEENSRAIEENDDRIRENQGLLALYSSVYGSITGDLSAYTDALNNFTNTKNIVDSVSDSFTTLADIQAAVANGFTLSLDKALEFASAYPEILDKATVTADGELQLNDQVVNGFISGKKAELDAQIDAEIQKLESEKAVLTAKMANAKAQLELAKNVGEGEGKISKEVAEYRLNANNALTQALIENGIDEATANQLAAAAMAGNEEEFARVAMESFKNMDENSAKAAYNMAHNIFLNAQNSSKSIAEIAKQAHESAAAIAAMGNGEIAGSETSTFNGANGTKSGGEKLELYTGKFEGTDFKYEKKDISLDDFISDIELDISDYEKGIDQIDGQIAVLQGLKNKAADSLKGFASKGSGSGSGSGGGSKGSKGSSGSGKKEVDEYVVEIDKYYKALKRLEEATDKRDEIEKQYDKAEDPEERLELSKKLVKAYRGEVKAAQNLIDKRSKTIEDNVKQLEKLGFVVDYDAETNHLLIENMKHVNDLEAKSKGEYDTRQEATNAYRKEVEELINDTEGLNDANRDTAKSIEDLNLKIDDTKGSAKDTGKEIEEYVADIDEYYEAIKRLERAQRDRSSVEKQLDRLTDPEDRIAQSRRLIQAYRNEMDAERNLMSQKSSGIQKNVKELRKRGFEVYYNAETNDFFIKNLEHLNELMADSKGDYETLQEATNAYRKETEELIDTTEQLNDDNVDAAESIEDLGDEILDTKNAIIDAIEEIYEKQIDAYNEIIDARKESIESAKDEYDYEADVAEKVKEIAELQSRIDQLSLDDSRGAAAERAELMKELEEKQKDLAEAQADYSYDAQIDALDDMAEGYEKEKNDELEILRETVGQSEELWAAFYDALQGKSVELGASINDSIASAWLSAADNVRTYSEEMGKLPEVIAAVSAAFTPTPTYEDVPSGNQSGSSGTGSGAAGKSTQTPSVGTWGEWVPTGNGSAETRTRTDTVGDQELVVTETRITGNPRTEKVKKAKKTTKKTTKKKTTKKKTKKYHTGGIVGAGGVVDDDDLEKDEVLAILQSGEIVLDEEKQQSLYRVIDFQEELSSRLRDALAANPVTVAVPDAGHLAEALATGATTNNSTLVFEPHIDVNISSGSASQQEAARFGEQIADAALDRLYEAFGRRGITSAKGSRLRP